MKRKKILQHLVKCIEHDFGFYNPIWKWSSLPDDIKNNYDLIEKDLMIWKNEGYIDIFTEDNILSLKIYKVPIIENSQS